MAIAVRAGTALRDAYASQLRPIAATVAVGAVLGAVIGGVGGRLAMRLLFLTSDPGVQGVTSDDGFTIGVITAATFALVAVGAFFGVAGALIGPTIDWALRPGSWFRTAPPWLALAPLALVLLPGPPLLLFGLPVIAVIGAHHAVRSSAHLSRLADHRMTWAAVRGVWIVVAVLAGADLVRKSAIIL